VDPPPSPRRATFAMVICVVPGDVLDITGSRGRPSFKGGPVDSKCTRPECPIAEICARRPLPLATEEHCRRVPDAPQLLLSPFGLGTTTATIRARIAACLSPGTSHAWQRTDAPRLARACCRGENILPIAGDMPSTARSCPLSRSRSALGPSTLLRMRSEITSNSHSPLGGLTSHRKNSGVSLRIVSLRPHPPRSKTLCFKDFGVRGASFPGSGLFLFNGTGTVKRSPRSLRLTPPLPPTW
jgi:hypothetical protein